MRFRLLPVLIFTAFIALTARVGDLWQGVGSIARAQSAAPAGAAAAAANAAEYSIDPMAPKPEAPPVQDLPADAAGVLNIAPKNKGKVVIAALAFLAAGFVAFAYSSGPVVALLILAFVGLCAGIVGVLITSVIQLSTPTEIRGRVFGLLGTVSAGLMPISLGLAGVIADLLDRNIPLIYMVSGLCVLALLPPLIVSKSFHSLMAFVGEEERLGTALL